MYITPAFSSFRTIFSKAFSSGASKTCLHVVNAKSASFYTGFVKKKKTKNNNNNGNNSNSNGNNNLQNPWEKKTMKADFSLTMTILY